MIRRLATSRPAQGQVVIIARARQELLVPHVEETKRLKRQTQRKKSAAVPPDQPSPSPSTPAPGARTSRPSSNVIGRVWSGRAQTRPLISHPLGGGRCVGTRRQDSITVADSLLDAEVAHDQPNCDCHQSGNTGNRERDNKATP